MESKKEPMGMCEKLFNVFNVNNSAFRPLRRLTIKNHQEPPPPTTTPHPNKPIPSQVLENNNNNNINPSHHHHHTPTTSSLIPHEPQQQTTTPSPPPKKLPLDAIQVQAPSSKIEIQNQLQAQQKVPVNHRSTTTTTTNKEEAAPKIVVQAPQAQLPVPTPPAMAPPPATVAGRRQPQRLETKNIDGKADDFINRVRDKLKNGSNVGRGAATSKSN